MKSKRSIKFSPQAEKDLDYWHKTDVKLFEKIFMLCDAIQLNPYSGIGKPEPLKHHYSGCWSRRINLEHRLIYEVTDTGIFVVACRYHY